MKGSINLLWVHNFLQNKNIFKKEILSFRSSNSYSITNTQLSKLIFVNSKLKYFCLISTWAILILIDWWSTFRQIAIAKISKESRPVTDFTWWKLIAEIIKELTIDPEWDTLSQWNNTASKIQFRATLRSYSKLIKTTKIWSKN